MLPRKATRPLVLLLLLYTTLGLGATFTLFQAAPANGTVRASWATSSADHSAGNESYRANDASRSGGRYHLFHPNTYSALQSDGLFFCNLPVRTATSNQQYPSALGQTPSAVQRSWGSIKSMFR